eukprot:1160261-Pelagomonas_calceolata.AAC.4
MGGKRKQNLDCHTPFHQPQADPAALQPVVGSVPIVSAPLLQYHMLNCAVAISHESLCGRVTSIPIQTCLQD